MLLSRHTRRREFIAGLGAAAWPVVARAQQQTDKVWRVGYLTVMSATNVNSVALFDDFRRKLNDLGYVEGRNLNLYVRWANEDFARLPGLASELVSLAPHVIVSAGTSTTLAFQRATSSIPIVMSASSDPIIGKIACKTRRQHHGVVQSESRLDC
jgi:putative ABC transport system substrate-binding protein